MKPQTPPATCDVAQLVLRHQAGVWRYLRSLGCDAALAEDLTQETFLAVLQRPFEDRNPSATFKYLRTVAKNLLINLQRRSSKVSQVADIEELDAFWDRLGDDHGEAMLAALRECMARLAPRARRALELRFGADAARCDIAQQLGMSENGAKNLMQRAKTRLRECIERKLRSHND
jgi:RNA polymerase sigma-70 factor (ECF subfamily)